MHAYLIIGNDVGDLALKLSAKILEFPIQKIDDTRELNKLMRLGFSEKTLIVCPNIEKATEESLNAFLKNLEEPQENIFFALSTSNISQVLPTIVSRCQVIKTHPEFKQLNNEEIEKFLNMNKIQKLSFFEKIKEREVALKFIEDLMKYLESNNKFDSLELILKTYTRLKANGNVNLHLSNLAINYEY